MELPDSVLLAREPDRLLNQPPPKAGATMFLPNIHAPQFGFVTELGPVKSANADGANQVGRKRTEHGLIGIRQDLLNELDRPKAIVAGRAAERIRLALERLASQREILGRISMVQFSGRAEALRYRSVVPSAICHDGSKLAVPT